MIPQRGQPMVEARYVVFVAIEGPQSRGWVEPIIAAWHGGKWHVEHGRPVYGWIGPLPALKTGFFFDNPVRPAIEYDL